ncbi:MAG: prolyl endopeptidase [Bacteroidetes bacterium GWC2_33_15]|nr:MAG: prolyl endopeptidase [Bacteroidetes bacterium GWA2_33_15]OFX50223.1 MAG: prolyl endopeptidase [Bacteroidetes bacterium GWC2_33_15]OFX65376.1 MAG: prolyl endopeptidase [Bacteroidetes bacterium GWB2_32_14]OFX70602.1 MAG: prolyl endopeptidase [Bacteroidetes bacterium GWD2_33_33]
MIRKALTILLVALTFMVSCNKRTIQYPETRKADQKDVYFGVEVVDPYRWLEDDKSAETENWVKAQNQVTFDYLSRIPYREKIKERLTQLWNFETMQTPVKKAGKLYFLKNDGLQNQDVLYMQNTPDGEPVVLLDPNKLSEDGTVALGAFEVSNDGKYLAYEISKGGSDWQEILVKNIETGEELPDNIKWVKFSKISWYKDGFFYSRYDEPASGEELSGVNKFHKVFYHKIGTLSQDDKLIYNNQEFPLRNYSAQVSNDEKYLFIYETQSTNGNNLYVKNLNKDDNFVKLTTGFNYDYTVLDHVDDNLFVITNYNAPKYKLVRINVNTLDVGNWIDIIPEKKDVLSSCELAGGKVIASYMCDAYSKLETYDFKGNFLSEIKLPATGSVNQINGTNDDNTAFYSFRSFTAPSTVFMYDLAELSSKIFFEPKLDFDTENYETKQVFFTSKDGTKIPMFIIHKKGLELNGKNPTQLYAYGGFNVSQLPSFSVERLILLENGGVFALANIRGGGEYGENWHKAGVGLNKQNVFDDFIAASEYLINEGYTSPKKLSVRGGSNGGLLIGTVLNQRPDLYAVAFPEVGVMDMLRFHLFTIGWAWVDEYGSSKDSIQFENLYNYSPLHNISDRIDYPAVMVITADHDDRVVPAHSFKYIATLQEKYTGNNPVLIRIQTKAGHSAGKPTSMKIEEAADRWAFAFYNMNVEPIYAE